MKKTMALMVAALMCCATVMAAELKQLVVKTTPEVQTVEALTKVKNQLRLTAGVKKVESDPTGDGDLRYRQDGFEENPCRPEERRL